MPKNMTNIDIREYEGGDFAKIEDNYTDRQVQVAIANRAEKLIERIKTLENNPDVVDIVATYADLQAYDTSQLTDKDVIRVLQDETHDGDSTYYRWSTATNTWTYIGESKQYTDFVGTDGTTAGEAGLVPAPATTDAGKFLKADGTWDDAGSTYTAGDGIDITNDVIKATNTGKARVLTTADYNYPTANPTKIALWLLDPGFYIIPNDTPLTIEYGAGEGTAYGSQGETFLVGVTKAGKKWVLHLPGSYNGCILFHYSNLAGSGSRIWIGQPVNNLTSTSTIESLSANQGKVLNDKIGGDLSNLTTTDKTSLINAINEVAGQGGGGVTELTTADYDWPTDNPTGVAAWLLEPGIYVADESAAGQGNEVLIYPNRQSVPKRTVLLIVGEKDNNSYIPIINRISSTDNGIIYSTNKNTGYPYSDTSLAIRALLDSSTVVNNLTSSIATLPLSANQGKVLSGRIGDLSTLTTTDKTSAVAAINEIAASAGGGGITELTTADYNYPADNPTSIALWLLDNGEYYVANDSVGVRVSTTEIAGRGIYTVADYSATSKQIIVNDLIDDIYGIYRVNKSTGVQGDSQSYALTAVQTTGTSTTDVMSQNATTSMVYADPSSRQKVQIGNTGNKGNSAVTIGSTGTSYGNNSISIGLAATANANNSVAFAGGNTTTVGVMQIGINNIGWEGSGYNSSNYRLLSGLYDGQSAHDAATYGQLSTAIINGGTTAPTTATVGAVGTLYSAVESGTAHLYACTAVDTTDPSNPTYTWSTLV